MLRTVRSLPSLRVLNSACVGSSSITTYNLSTPNIPHPELTIKRHVHQTNKNQTTLLNSSKNEFALMSLNSLKQECRKRGLKVSGRKAELVLRISTFEKSFNYSNLDARQMSTITKEKSGKSLGVNITHSMQFSQIQTPKAKGDDSHIDFIKPVDLNVEEPRDDYVTQIPSISSKASRTPVTPAEEALIKKLPTEEEALNKTIVSKAEGSDTKIFEQGSIENIEEQNFNADNANIGTLEDEGQQEEQYVETPYQFDHSEIPKRDKSIWTSFAVAFGGIFALKKTFEK